MSSGLGTSRLALLFAVSAALLGIPATGYAGTPATTPTSSPAYKVDDPMYPVAYTEAQKESQRQAARDVIRQINTTITSGGERFTVLPGVYRVPADGPDTRIKFARDKPLRLNLANTEFILENGGNFLFPPPRCESITIAGPVKFDADPLAFSQAIVVAHDDATGVTRLKIMPGYAIEIAPKGTIDAFTSAGELLPNPSWAEYSDAQTLDAAAGLVELKTSTKTEYRGLYEPGNLVAMRAGSPVLFSSRDTKHLTVKDADIYTGVGVAWGGGAGDWSFTNIRGVRRPGTNRLYAAGGCQVSNYGGDVTFDHCEFGNTTDDLMDYSGGGLAMIVRVESPRELLAWGGTPSTGDGLNLYAHADFHLSGTAKLTKVVEVIDPAAQAEAHRLIAEVLQARKVGDKPLYRLTFDRDVAAAPADFIENATARRPNHFTCRNCYFHDSGGRVLVQGFQHGLFENNRFERISGGLALTCDPWSWDGPTCQDITVRNNVFIDTTYRTGRGTGKAALAVGPTTAPADPSTGVAFRGVNVTGNRFLGSSSGAIAVSNAGDVAIKDNIVERPFSLSAPQSAIHLRGIVDGQVSGNTITNCPGAGIVAEHVNNLLLKGNNFQNTYRGIGVVLNNIPSAVIALIGCREVVVQGNWLIGSDAAHAISLTGSRQVHLQGNRASKMAAPAAALLELGPGNTDVTNDDKAE